MVAVALTWTVHPATDVQADHSPAGSGGCAGHTLVCFPECRWEWTGGTSLTTPDVGPCPVPGEVGVTNLPATQAVEGTVNVGNEPTVHCVTGASAECRSTVVEGAASSEDAPLFVKTAGDGGAVLAAWRHETVFALGVVLFVLMALLMQLSGRRG